MAKRSWSYLGVFLGLALGGILYRLLAQHPSWAVVWERLWWQSIALGAVRIAEWQGDRRLRRKESAA